MPANRPVARAAAGSRSAVSRWLRWVASGLCACGIAACSLFAAAPPPAPPPSAAPSAPEPPPAPPPAPASEPAADPATPADLATRRLLTYNEQLRTMSPADLGAEVARLSTQTTPGSNPPASPDVRVQLALALAQQHNPGDLARAADLLAPLTQPTAPDMQAWQPIARLLADRIAEQRRLEDQLDQQAAQRRDTQRTIQQLTEKLEGLKAIERSMATRPGPAPAPPPVESAPAAPKSP